MELRQVCRYRAIVDFKRLNAKLPIQQEVMIEVTSIHPLNRKEINRVLNSFSKFMKRFSAKQIVTEEEDKK